MKPKSSEVTIAQAAQNAFLRDYRIRLLNDIRKGAIADLPNKVAAGEVLLPLDVELVTQDLWTELTVKNALVGVVLEAAHIERADIKSIVMEVGVSLGYIVVVQGGSNVKSESV